MDITNARFGELVNVMAGFGPVDMAAGANDGDWVGLANYERIAVLLFKAAGTAGQDVTITLQQATDNAGTGAKDLACIDTVYRKQGTLTSIGQWTVDEQTAAASWTNDTNAEQAMIALFDVRRRDLDIDNDFDYIRARVADVGAGAQLGAMLYFGLQPLYGEGATLPSAL